MAISSLEDTHGDPAPASVQMGRGFRKISLSPVLGRMSRFAAVGAFGTVLNLAIMAVMLGMGTHYLVAALVATELTILSNFLMQERLVFSDMRDGRPFWQRLAASFGFNNVETLVRIPVLMLLVDLLLIPGLVAQAATLAAAFLVRFAFTSRVIYRVRPSASAPVLPVPQNVPVRRRRRARHGPGTAGREIAFLIRSVFTSSRVVYRIRPVASRPVLVASLYEEQQP